MDNQLNIGHVNMVSFVSHRKNVCCMLEICVILVIHSLLYLNIYLKLTSFTCGSSSGTASTSQELDNTENSNTYCLKFIQKST